MGFYKNLMSEVFGREKDIFEEKESPGAIFKRKSLQEEIVGKRKYEIFVVD